MINKVRETVLSILNKNNYGYLSPLDFNLYAKQAQLELFEDYFYDFNTQINRENARTSGTEYADITRQLSEVMDTFTQYTPLSRVVNSEQTFILPQDWYTFVDVVWLQICEGPPTTIIEEQAERVSEGSLYRLLKSNLTAPSKEFPAYVFTQQGRPIPVGPGDATYGNLGNQITLYPEPASGCDLGCRLTYIRYPKDPNWTSSTLPSGEAFFNSSVATYQDFELPSSDENDLIMKILQYAGLSIREAAVTQFAAAQEAIDSQQNT